MAEEFSVDIGPINRRLYEPVPFVRTNNSIKDVNADIFIRSYANHLKVHNKITFPKWCTFVKTGKGRKLAAKDDDWYYIKAASILRKLYLKPDMGVTALRRHFSCKQRRGVAPNRYSLASGKIIRTIIQQFESLGYIEQNPKKKGRRLTKKGSNAINNFAIYINKKIYKLDEKKKEKKKEQEDEEEQEQKKEDNGNQEQKEE